MASSYGGTRNGMVVHWPKGIQAKGEVRSQWHHVIDVAPTILEAAGPARAEDRERDAADADRGREHGLHASTMRRPKDRHTTQYFEIVRQPRASTTTAGSPARCTARPGKHSRGAPLEDDKWELYDTRSRLQPGERPGREEPRRSSRRCRTLFLKEAVEIPRAADRRPLVRAVRSPSSPGGPT